MNMATARWMLRASGLNGACDENLGHHAQERGVGRTRHAPHPARLGDAGHGYRRLASGREFGGTNGLTMITRAVNRAAARMRGDHPRRNGEYEALRILLYDLLLIVAGVFALAGLVLVVIGLVQGFSVAKLLIGVGLVALGIVLLLLWERLFWGPIGRGLNKLS